MACDTITFQLGTHYLSRVALCVERLLRTIQAASLEQNPAIHHAALNNLFEIIRRTEKPELKSRFLQEFIRIEHVLNKSSTTALSSDLLGISNQIQVLSELACRFGGTIYQEALLTEHGAEGEYAPQLLFWLESDATVRKNDLIRWLKSLEPLQSTIQVYLSLLRNNAKFETITPKNGFYQCHLPHNNKTSCHLILVRMSKQSAQIPKMQTGHFGLSLRLCKAKTMEEIHDQSNSLELSICEI
ncbi:MAG: cell division protein ZapD [Gammaproteobacteria bacterium]|nr:cell division protein ZapD [Gammaproteobacteria bacterium]MCH9715817.1 cell division protein ZapD [Gammaproteobacteria bacterium]MCH9763499.1 cell division protein ZapD [Gammaproteobacteria bacterium]